MTSPPKRPILSLKFKTPAAGGSDLKPPVPPAPSPKTAGKSGPALKTTTFSKSKPAFKAEPAAKAAPVAKQPTTAKAPPAAKAEQNTRSAPAISPDVFKAAVKAATAAIVQVIADPEWKSQELLDQYLSARDNATSTHRQQAKLVSTVATRRHASDIDNTDLQNTAMRAAYAAALVVLVGLAARDE